MILLFILAAIIGLIQARLSILAVRNGSVQGVNTSESLINFVFFNK